MMYGVWYMMYGVWRMVSGDGEGCMVYDVRFVGYVVWCMVHDVLCMLCVAWCILMMNSG